MFPVDSSFIDALFFIIFARYANFKVDNVSENEPEAGDILAIIKVLELPPNESFNRKVNLESLYLICLYFPSDISTSELITHPNTVRDLLILVASFNLSPAAAVCFCLSEPAKSTK